jgi:Bifunctional DNA primase/polymerase, N-terminal
MATTPVQPSETDWGYFCDQLLVLSRMSHRSAGRFMPMPTAFACADHCSVVSPAGPASRRMAYIVSWHPGKLVGVPTGEASGLFVIDVDSGRHVEAQDWLKRVSPDLPPTRQHATKAFRQTKRGSQ